MRSMKSVGRYILPQERLRKEAFGMPWKFPPEIANALRARWDGIEKQRPAEAVDRGFKEYWSKYHTQNDPGGEGYMHIQEIRGRAWG